MGSWDNVASTIGLVRSWSPFNKVYAEGLEGFRDACDLQDSSW